MKHNHIQQKKKQMNPIYVEYVWIGGEDKYKKTSQTIRSKTKIIYTDKKEQNIVIPIWNYDGSSTGQATTENSEVIIIPRKKYLDPFRGGNNMMVLCDTYVRNDDGNLVPHKTNTRARALQIFEKYEDQQPWYGIEQEFFLLDNETGKPVGSPVDSRYHTNPQGQYYCGVGSLNAIERKIIEEIVGRALRAGIRVSGSNAEVAMGQWEIQIGPTEGIAAADDTIMLRYIMHKVTESYKCHVELFPKLSEHINGSGAHTNFSTKKMREDGGMKEIMTAIEKMEKNNNRLVKTLGEYSELRLTGKHETSSINEFSFGIGNRSATVRIPTQTAYENKGYLEWRAPSANCDPYLTTSELLASINE